MITRILNLFSKQQPGVQPIILVALGDRKKVPKLFACPTCGAAHSVKYYGIDAARELAANCNLCRPKQYTCDMCGCETREYWTRCDSCRIAAKLDAAVEVPDDGGPYFEFGGDRYYHELEEAAYDGVEWVCPTTPAYPRINADDILDGLVSDMHEDASTDDLDGVDAFVAAAEAFNTAQTCASYWADEKRKIRVPPLPAVEAEVAA